MMLAGHHFHTIAGSVLVAVIPIWNKKTFPGDDFNLLSYSHFFPQISYPLVNQHSYWGWPLKYSGWWFGTCFIFPYIRNVIIPIDVHIFQRGSNQPPTSFVAFHLQTDPSSSPGPNAAGCSKDMTGLFITDISIGDTQSVSQTLTIVNGGFLK